MALNLKKAEEKRLKADELIDSEFDALPKTSTETIIANLNQSKTENVPVESEPEEKPNFEGTRKFVMSKVTKTNQRRGQNRTVYFDDAQYNQIKKYADKAGISFSGMLYEILKQVL